MAASSTLYYKSLLMLSAQIEQIKKRYIPKASTIVWKNILKATYFCLIIAIFLF
jgi:hypothetical protein